MTASELVTLCQQRDPVAACWTRPDGVSKEVIILTSVDYQGLPLPQGTSRNAVDVGFKVVDLLGNEQTVTDANELTLGGCECNDRVEINNCFLPDQYAIIWAINGSGDLLSYNPIEDVWTDHGNVSPGSYALAFDNNLGSPAIYYQRNGELYKVDPSSPSSGSFFVGDTDPHAGGSYPWLAFDPQGRLLVGPVSPGTSIAIIDPSTGATTYLGNIIDTATGNRLLTAGGDWTFDPAGGLYVLTQNPSRIFQIDLATLEATEVTQSPAPFSGNFTGFAWSSANKFWGSRSTGEIWQYDVIQDTWTLVTTAPNGINDLDSQFIIPDAIPVVGWMDLSGCGDGNATDGDTDPDNDLDDDGVYPDCAGITLFTYEVDTLTQSVVCRRFEPRINGKFGNCVPEGNPFVTDPNQSGESGGGCDTCSDQVWREGCSDAGYTLYRRYYDPSGNVFMEYLFGTLTEPTQTAPSGFNPIPCGEVIPGEVVITAFCDLGTNNTVYERQEILTDGTLQVTWFNETGTILEPTNLGTGACEQVDPLLPVTEQIICLDGEPAVRKYSEVLVPDGTGLPVLSQYQLIYFDNNGPIYDSGLLNADDSLPGGEPTDWYIGACIEGPKDVWRQKLCEGVSNTVLMVSSSGSGSFSSYEVRGGNFQDVFLAVDAAASGADIANGFLYTFNAANDLVVVDVKQSPPVVLNVLPRSGDFTGGTNAAAFDPITNSLWFIGGSSLYSLNVSTGSSTLLGAMPNYLSNSGASLAISPEGTVYVNARNSATTSFDNTSISTVNRSTFELTDFTDLPKNAQGMSWGRDVNGNEGIWFGSGDTTLNFLNLGTLAVTENVTEKAEGINSVSYYEVGPVVPKTIIREYCRDEVSGEVDFQDYDLNYEEYSPVGYISCCSLQASSGEGGSGGSTADPCPELAQPLVEVSGTGNIPAGLKSVTINNLTGVTIINGGFEIGNDRRPESISFGTDRSGCSNETLPAFNLSGGTWQWTGLQQA